MDGYRNANNGKRTVAMMARIGSARRGWARGAILALGVAIFASACSLDDLLEVDMPDQIPADGLMEPTNAKLLTDGAVGDFECAFGAYVALSAMMAQEMTDASPTANRWPYDRRNVLPTDVLYSTSGCTALGIYTPLSQARWSADNILKNLKEWSDDEVEDRQRLIATAAAYSGYSRVLLGEGFCSVAIDNGPEMTSAAVLQEAIDKFNEAIAAAQAAGDNDLLNFAYMGRARANLDLGNKAAALEDAKRIPPGFEYVMSASNSSSSRRHNRIFAQSGPTEDAGGSSLSVGPAYQNFMHMGVADPRIVAIPAGRNDDAGVPVVWQGKYTSLGAPIPIASYDEAQLIIAEIEGGDTAVDIINAFHTAAGLPLIDGSTMTPEEILEHVIEERKIELWLEGHRFHDIRRLNLPLVPEPGTPHRRGSSYGNNRCFPLPDVEIRNNPNI
jgi:hypothetical protein